MLAVAVAAVVSLHRSKATLIVVVMAVEVVEETAVQELQA
jgi:hypothetical protein